MLFLSFIKNCSSNYIIYWIELINIYLAHTIYKNVSAWVLQAEGGRVAMFK